MAGQPGEAPLGAEAGATAGPGAAQVTLESLGWKPEQAASFRSSARAGLESARVLSSGGLVRAQSARGQLEVVQRRRRGGSEEESSPAVGDWLAVEALPGEPGRALLRAVLPRRGTIVRARSGDGRPQVLATNLDLAFLVSGLDQDLNPRRIERYLLLAVEAGVRPVVILNKVDIAVDLPRAVAEVHAVVPGTRVITTSALTGAGVEEMRDQLAPGLTACLLGSSGVGKSSLTNALLGVAQQAVQDVREDDSRGRHTTASRELFSVPGAGLLVDTPGLRTVGVIGDEASLAASFEDIATLALQCRFNDCRHDGEPGCAVRAAIDSGRLSEGRLANHRKLEAELRSAVIRADVRSERAEGRRVGRLYRHHGKLVARYKRGEE